MIGLGKFDLYDAIVDHAILGIHQPLSQGGSYNPHWAVVSLLFIFAGVYIYQTIHRGYDNPCASRAESSHTSRDQHR